MAVEECLSKTNTCSIEWKFFGEGDDRKQLASCKEIGNGCHQEGDPRKCSCMVVVEKTVIKELKLDGQTYSDVSVETLEISKPYKLGLSDPNQALSRSHLDDLQKKHKADNVDIKAECRCIPAGK